MPETVTFGNVPADAKDVLSDKYLFRITNNTDEDIYSIIFKLRVDSSSVSAKDFKFDIPKSSQKALDENDPSGSKFGDIMGMDCVDVNGRPVFLRFLFHLSPHETREVTLQHINPSIGPKEAGLPQKLTIPSSEGIVVHAQVSHFTTTPTPRLTQSGLGAAPFYLDETLTCGAASFVVLK